ncbi:HNH endonuclease [Salmonella phage 1586]|uniref:Homing endonuclease n=1 Tax=Phage MSP1 TaxID=2801538 RepID=A0AB37G9K9_9VIRU
MITQERLKELLEYNPDTGIFIWKSRKVDRSGFNKQFAGKIAGNPQNNGYINITIDSEVHGAHRLAFLYMEGYMPARVDHENRVRSDNKWLNLREATVSQNGANALKYSNNSSGYKNVYWTKKTCRWQVQVMKDGKSYSGGYFTNLKDAVETANELRFELFGEFALYEPFKGDKHE